MAADILLHSGLTLLEARRIADEAGMLLISDGRSVVVSPYAPPGWWIVPLRLPAAPQPEGLAA